MTVMRCCTRYTRRTLVKLTVVSMVKRSIRQRLLYAWNINAYDFTILERVGLPPNYAWHRIMCGWIPQTDVRRRVRRERELLEERVSRDSAWARMNRGESRVGALIRERVRRITGLGIDVDVLVNAGAQQTSFDAECHCVDLLLSDYMMRPRNQDTTDLVWLGPFMWLQRIHGTWEFHQL